MLKLKTLSISIMLGQHFNLLYKLFKQNVQSYIKSAESLIELIYWTNNNIVKTLKELR